MGTVNASARWTGEQLNFIGTSYKGHQIPMGGENISPTQMLLLGLAGCTGMDVVSILQKKRQAVKDVQVQITAHQPDEYPKPYHTIEIKYIVVGENLDVTAVERAIALSAEKYCIVSQTLQRPVELKTSLVIETRLE
ncbi:MAG: OsmC family protein [Anaerolineales bacterium]|nr:OsmC family protein [Anaerolineales bacterium]